MTPISGVCNDPGVDSSYKPLAQTPQHLPPAKLYLLISKISTPPKDQIVFPREKGPRPKRLQAVLANLGPSPHVPTSPKLLSLTTVKILLEH
jgi:hypothetical protein